jgi:hypothetical protein
MDAFMEVISAGMGASQNTPIYKQLLDCCSLNTYAMAWSWNFFPGRADFGF